MALSVCPLNFRMCRKPFRNIPFVHKTLVTPILSFCPSLPLLSSHSHLNTFGILVFLHPSRSPAFFPSSLWLKVVWLRWKTFQIVRAGGHTPRQITARGPAALTQQTEFIRIALSTLPKVSQVRVIQIMHR